VGPIDERIVLAARWLVRRGEIALKRNFSASRFATRYTGWGPIRSGERGESRAVEGFLRSIRAARRSVSKSY